MGDQRVETNLFVAKPKIWEKNNFLKGTHYSMKKITFLAKQWENALIHS